MEWRLKVDQVVERSFDPGVALASDDAHTLGFGFGPDAVIGIPESGLVIPVAAGVFHEYRVVTPNMWNYELYIDGHLAHAGTFWEGASRSYMAWGDSVQGAGSSHHWDYIRFGIMPAEPSTEPNSFLLVGVLVACRVGRRE